MKGTHAVGDYVVFTVGDEKLRGYIQETKGGNDEPAAYIVRSSGRDYEVHERDIIDG